MNSIESPFDVHSKIMLGLANVLVNEQAKVNTEDITRLVAKCPMAILTSPNERTVYTKENTPTSLGVMNHRSQSTIEALIAYVSKASEDRQSDMLPRLIAYLRYLPAYSWEHIVPHKDPPSDCVTYSLVSCLLEMAWKHPVRREEITQVLQNYCACIIDSMNEDPDYTVLFLLPSLLGFLRALQRSPFLSTMDQLNHLCQTFTTLARVLKLDHVRDAIKSCLVQSQDTSQSHHVLTSYIEKGEPLSSNRLLYEVLLMLRNIIASALITQQREYIKTNNDECPEKSSAWPIGTETNVWKLVTSMTFKPVVNLDEEIQSHLRDIYSMSVEYFKDSRTAAKSSTWCKTGIRCDDYIPEILGSSMQLATLCSVFLHNIDKTLPGYIYKSLLLQSDVPYVQVYTASLDTATILALNFSSLNTQCIQFMGRFLTSPTISITKVPELKGKSYMTVQQYAAKRLAQSIQVNPSDQHSDITLSVLYMLLNHITRYCTEETTQYSIFGSQKSIFDDLSTTFSCTNQNTLVCTNALTAIIDIVTSLRDDSLVSQVLSMLVFRRKTFPEPVLATFITKLVDLALISSSSSFGHIITIYSIISKENLLVDHSPISSTLHDSQILLAKKLKERHDLCPAYLQNLVTLFVENGNTVQRHLRQTSSPESLNPTLTKLGNLLYVMGTLLGHPELNPQDDHSEETVVYFRNMWFHCIMFGFLTESIWVHKWYPSLVIIAEKTPILVIESATDYLESDLKYNSVIRSGESKVLSQDIRDRLSRLLPSIAYDIKSYSFADAVFSLGVFYIEMMRSKANRCSYVLRYFMKEGILNNRITSCLDAIGEKVVKNFLKEISEKAMTQNIGSALEKETAVLLKLCCHRIQDVYTRAINIMDRIVATFPQVFADKELINLLLELLQLLWRSCEAEFRDEYSPIYYFESERAKTTVELGDSFSQRTSHCTLFYTKTKKWIYSAMESTPMVVSSLLQDYLADFESFSSLTSINTVHLGRSLALEIGKSATSNELAAEFEPKLPQMGIDNTSGFVHGFTCRRHFTGEIGGIEFMAGLQNASDKVPSTYTGSGLEDQVSFVKSMLYQLLSDVRENQQIHVERLRCTLYRAAAFVIALHRPHPELMSYLVKIPVELFSTESMLIGTDIWNWILTERPRVKEYLLTVIFEMWVWAQRQRKGIFSPAINTQHPFTKKMTYTPSDKEARRCVEQAAGLLFRPHVVWIMFLESNFSAAKHQSRRVVDVTAFLLMHALQGVCLMSTHPLARSFRMEIVLFGFKIMSSIEMEAQVGYIFRSLLYSAAFHWFKLPPRWHYGARKSLALRTYKLLIRLRKVVAQDSLRFGHTITTISSTTKSSVASGLYRFFNNKTRDDVVQQYKSEKKLLLLLIDNEISRLTVWNNPLNVAESEYTLQLNSGERSDTTIMTDDEWKTIVRFAWNTCPVLAVRIGERFPQIAVQRELHQLIANNTLNVVDEPEALVILFGYRLKPNANLDLKYLKYWAPVPAITAASYTMPAYGQHPVVLQYAMRSLEYYPIDTVFFYVPQIVQALRHDRCGYIKRYILHAGQVSQLFAHQIIWNMQANFYIDADKGCVKSDTIKPLLEKIIAELVHSFTGEDRSFYEREFKFFGDITAISGYLKEYIKFGQEVKKPLQKKRLDEELGKIKVDVGVYLPSNPEGHVVDINRTSGRPLQSHAKAPFMATFRIERQKETSDTTIIVTKNVAIQKDRRSAKLLDSLQGDDDEDSHTEKLWQGAIFKVGDDCRQDVLALQLIAVFKNIFMSVGLDMYVYPYRVVATAPGRGVIDVIPRSISRDQLGREKVNSMYDYFVAKYGPPSSIHFQRARTNFVQSAAAYSVISYLLQIKDRHNGNIMLDDDGHIIHIDFGFIFDIAPGGITFESSPFKLTAEMVQVMGGSSDQQTFKEFSELVVKAYLACRPYAKEIMQLVALMLQSGLPCFRGDTIKRMQARFQLDKSERAAADFMGQKIKESLENQRTVLYDYFQKLTNGIPC